DRGGSMLSPPRPAMAWAVSRAGRSEAGRAGRREGSLRQLLADITVVELAEGVAGSYCAKLFADLGAAVVKVERRGGDPLRRRASPSAPARGEWRDGTWMHLNTNKRS